MDGCVKDLSNLIFEIGVVFRRRFHAPPVKKGEYPIFCKQTLTSQKPKLIFRIFFDNPTGEAFMYII
jgi:hypothetical protein